jgi:hypothetical protein
MVDAFLKIQAQHEATEWLIQEGRKSCSGVAVTMVAAGACWWGGQASEASWYV